MEFKNLTMAYGNQELYNNVNLFLDSKSKIGIVGVNGAGKSTLFKLIMGEISPIEGKIKIPKKVRVGWLNQVMSTSVLESDIKTLDYLIDGRPIKKLETKLQQAYEELANSSDQEKIFNKIDNIQEELNYWDSYNAENELLRIVDGINIPLDLLDSSINSLSGGQKTKVAFAKLLYSKPELILLDEPTNHLDEDGIKFVTKFLKKYKGSLLIISHDTKFLDETTDKTLLLDKRTKTMELFDGNYSKFIRINQSREENLIRTAEIQERKANELKQIINQYSNSSGKRKKMAQDREKKLEKLLTNKIEIAPKKKEVKIDIKMNKESAMIPLKVKNISFSYNKDKQIISNLSFDLHKHEKFLIVGKNGIGKSTLLKLIVNELTPNSGEIDIANNTEIGYYAQEHEILNNNLNIIDNFKDLNIPTKTLRTVLGNFLFHGNEVFKKVKVLSPGEKCRVALAKLSLSGANFLVLDEPTNHLDPETQKIIADTFRDYKGTMLIVSHNPEFIDNLGVERTLILPQGTISYYEKDIIKHFEKINKIK